MGDRDPVLCVRGRDRHAAGASVPVRNVDFVFMDSIPLKDFIPIDWRSDRYPFGAWKAEQRRKQRVEEFMSKITLGGKVTLGGDVVPAGDHVPELLMHIARFANELGADLEMGSHQWNNWASKMFAQKHKRLLEWADKLHKLAEQVAAERKHDY